MVNLFPSFARLPVVASSAAKVKRSSITSDDPSGRTGASLFARTRNLLGFPKQPSPPLPAKMGQNDRQILDDPRDAWQLWFPRNLTVQQVVNILRASRMGDQWQMASLVEVMLDSWPMLKKCQHELRSAVSQTKFSVHAYTQGGKEPSARAKEKADLVLRAMTSYRPDPSVTDERGFPGMVYDLTNAYLLGITTVEQQWHQLGKDTLPRAATFVHPAHIVLDDFARVQLANTRDGSTIKLDPNYFLTSVFQSQSGSVYAMGMVRSVGWWWSVMLAAQQWMFGSGQKYGSPYTFLTYARSLMGNTVELDKIEAALNNSGANRYIMAPEGTTADLKPPGTMGTENPQRYLKEQADKEVQMLFLGQTSSSTAEPGRLGNNDQHMEVRSERKEAVAKWIGNVLTEQWAAAILRRNYGNDDECPTVEPDLTEVETRMQTAQRIAVVVNTGLPIVAEELYNDLNLRVPEMGDMVVQRGQLGKMSDPAGTPIQPTLEEQVDQHLMIAEAQGEAQGGAMPTPGGQVQAKGRVKATGSMVGHAFRGNQWTRQAKHASADPVGTFPTGKIKRAVLVIDGKRYRGPSHFQALQEWGTAHPREMRLPKAQLEGFETESGHFLDREQAAEYALSLHPDQFREQAGKQEAEETGSLISEDLRLAARGNKLYTRDAVQALEKRTWITLKS